MHRAQQPRPCQVRYAATFLDLEHLSEDRNQDETSDSKSDQWDAVTGMGEANDTFRWEMWKDNDM